MNRSTLARRYAPLAVLAGIQLLIIALVPSKPPQEGVAAGASENVGGPADTFTTDTAPDLTVPGAAPVSGTPGAGGPAGSATGATRGATGTVRLPTGEVVVPGDTSHCKEDRQFDANLYWYAPKCVPQFGGDNGGATYTGVTDSTIKVVWYHGKPNEAVDALLRSQNAAPEPADQTALAKAMEKFINAHYELYGRRMVIEEFNGQCTTVPPDYPCLRNEMREVVQARKPFAVVWITSLASPGFDELSNLKVVNLGGWHFRDSFNTERRPYHYDLPMGGTQVVKHVAEWYCKRMHGGGQFKARYAGKTGTGQGENPPNNDIRNKPRVLGVISTDDPENKNAITEFKAELAKCGAQVAHEYYYAQDIARAEEQRRLGVAKMRESPESTTIMCFCDLVAPIFLYQTCEEQKYYPEHVIVGTGFMDADNAAQAYDNTLPPKGYQFENAFGLSSLAEPEPRDSNDANRVYKWAGNKDPIPSRYGSASLDWNYFALLASLIQGAGARLTPASLEAGAGGLGIRGGAAQTLDLRFNQRSVFPTRGDYTWNDDMRETYWSTQKRSPFNGRAGSYVTLNSGRRFNLGEYLSGEFTMPDKPR